MSHLANLRFGIRLAHTLPQRSPIQLQHTSIRSDKVQIPKNPTPHPGPGRKAPLHIIALQPDEIEVAHDHRPQLLQHVQLRIKVVLEQALVRAAGELPRLLVHGPVEVDGHGVHVVKGTYEEFKGEASQGAVDEGFGLGTDPVAFEADDDLDLGGVFLA